MPRIVRSEPESSSSSSWLPMLVAGVAIGAVVLWLATRRRGAGTHADESPFADTELDHPGDPELLARLRAQAGPESPVRP